MLTIPKNVLISENAMPLVQFVAQERFAPANNKMSFANALERLGALAERYSASVELGPDFYYPGNFSFVVSQKGKVRLVGGVNITYEQDSTFSWSINT